MLKFKEVIKVKNAGGLEFGSRGRASSLQVRSSQFKSQSYPQKMWLKGIHPDQPSHALFTSAED
jgi:hypothetical protein